MPLICIKNAAGLMAFIVAECLWSQPPVEPRLYSTMNAERVVYVPNMGQWQGDEFFRAQANGALIYLDADGIRFAATDHNDVARIHHQLGVSSENEGLKLAGHVWGQRFLGCQPVVPAMLDTLSEYRNYLIGDKSHHRNFVPVCTRVVYRDLWPGIDLLVHSRAGQYSYQFEVHPGADPGQIRWTYEGLDGYEVKDSLITLQTSVGVFHETGLSAWQLGAGRIKPVACAFAGNSCEVSVVTEAYDLHSPLIIDPTLVAATYVGSLSTSVGQEHWGYHAGYDAAGNIYLVSMPTEDVLDATPGAFDSTFAGSNDIGITKFNQNGSQRLWCTYLGGSGDDRPRNLVVNATGEPILLGTTFAASENFPVGDNGFDTTIGGFMDQFVIRLSADGSQITAGTYLGGDFGEGGKFTLPNNLNFAASGNGLALDAEGNVLIGSSSSEVGMENYLPRFVFGGENARFSDAFVFKLGSELDTLHWCAQICSGYQDEPILGVETVYDLDLMANGSIVLTGSTSGTSMPFPDGGYDTQPHMQIDGWLARLSADGQQLLAGTYLATDSADEVRMVDIGPDGHIWCTAVTNGTFPQTDGIVSNAGSQTYVAKFDPDLTSLEICTRIGANDPAEYLFLEKGFMVDDCGRIYVSGHGLVENLDSYDSTEDAFYNVGGFYCGVYEPDMSALAFGTLFGGDHNDGGISQYDSRGIVYQAVCQCSSEPPFAALDGAFDPFQSPSCEAAVYKIDFQSESLTSAFMYTPLTHCLPYEVEFTNWSDSATYWWDLGNGIWQEIDTMVFTHTYELPGDYLVRLAGYNDQTCNIYDTSSVVIHVPTVESVLSSDWLIQYSDLCADTVLVEGQFTGSGADGIQWDLDGIPAAGDSFSSVVTTPGEHLIAMMAVDSSCGYSQSLSDIFFTGPAVFLDTVIVEGDFCVPAGLEFNPVTSADSTWWVFGDSQSSFGLPGTSHEYHTAGEFELLVIGYADSACVASDTLSFTIHVNELPVVEFSLDDTLCVQKGSIALENAIPAGGEYSGPGVSGVSLDLSTLSPGPYEIVYSYTDSLGCANAAIEIVEVALCDYIPAQSDTYWFSVAPNPAREIVMIRSNASGASVFDHQGRLIYLNDHLPKALNLPVAGWETGTYQVKFDYNNGLYKTVALVVIH